MMHFTLPTVKGTGQLSFTLPLELCLQALTMVSGRGAGLWTGERMCRTGEARGLLSGWPVL